MRIRFAPFTTLALLLSLAAPGIAPAQGAPASMPDSPAGRAVAAWFAAINDGTEDDLRRVIESHFTDDVPRDQRIRNWGMIRSDLRPLTPLRVMEGPREMVVVARDKSGSRIRVTFPLRGDPPRITGIDIEPDEEAPAEAEEDPTPLTEAQMLARVAHLADSLAALDRFAGVVRLERAGRIALERAWGEADRERHVANRADTKFNLGSINKNFTKSLIAKLVEQGKLSTDDRLSKHLPDYPRDKADRITIQQLLDMRSGLGDFFNQRYVAMDKSKLREQRDWFPLFVDDPLLFEPGEGEEYSNAGYVVLGAVAEAVTGRNYYDLVREMIYRPAGMSNTDSYGLDENVPNRALNYTRRARGGPIAGGPLESNRPLQPWRGSAAGGGYSTAEDLSRYLAALREGKILQPATAERFFGARPGPDGKLRIGLGIAGGSPGVNAALMTAGPWTIVVLANADPPVAETIAEHARRWIERVEPIGAGQMRRVRR